MRQPYNVYSEIIITFETASSTMMKEFDRCLPNNLRTQQIHSFGAPRILELNEIYKGIARLESAGPPAYAAFALWLIWHCYPISIYILAR